jgi:hypothetical protein
MADQGSSHRIHEHGNSATQPRGDQHRQPGGQLSPMSRGSNDPLYQMGEKGGDVINYLTEYARQNPGYAALWCLGVGFVLGWKLKPW